ncbi:MAG: acyl-CoA dehydrogenase family protein [Microthrixaceae bacterium]
MSTPELALDDEQAALEETVARFVDAEATIATTRALVESGADYDPAVWAQLAGDLGLVALGVPEYLGGAGRGLLEASIVARELGRVLYSGPYLPVTMALVALVAGVDTDTGARWLPTVVAGEVVVTPALAGLRGRWSPAEEPPEATEGGVDGGDSWVIDGSRHLVMAAGTADAFVVPGLVGDAVGLFVVPVGDQVTVTRLDTLDLTRTLSMVEFASAPAELLVEPGQAETVLESMLNWALVLQANESAGAAGECVRLSVEYAKVRTQFDEPIGSYQAVAHTCAEMFSDAEHAGGSAHYAAAAAAFGASDAALAARVAAAYVGRSFESIAESTIHVHGGIGFTWEHDAHLYYRRARSAGLLFGRYDEHLEAVATLSGL